MARTVIAYPIADVAEAEEKAQRMLAALKYNPQSTDEETVYKKRGIFISSRFIRFYFEDGVMVVEAWVHQMGTQESGVDEAGASLPKILLIKDLEKLRIYTEVKPEESEED